MKRYMKRLKYKILRDGQQSTSSPTDNPMPSASSSTCNTTPSTSFSTARSSDTYICGVDILAVLAIGICVFFTYDTSQAANKKQSMKNSTNHQNNVICFKKYTINE